MDQNSSNGSGKSNWREKLGIGTGVKDIPKIANEINASRVKPNTPAQPAAPTEPKLTVKPAAGAAPRAPQSAAKVAPMAPRVTARAAQPPQRIVKPAPQGENPLAEKLRAQRQAAERAAEQRILQARERAIEPDVAVPAQPPGGRPKFTFAEEELVQAKKETLPSVARTPAPPVTAPPLPAPREYTPVFQQPRQSGQQTVQPSIAPPRPQLGGERHVANPAAPRERPTVSGYQQQFSAPSQPQAYRPLDPPGFKRPAPLAPPQRNYAPPQARYPDRPGTDPRLAAQREAYEAYRRGLVQAPPGEDEEVFSEEAPRYTKPPQSRPRPAAIEDDLAEVFDDKAPPAPRRRASAQEYNQAYREFEDGYVDASARRSSGPWLLLGLLLVAAIVTAAGVWFYQKSKVASTAPVNNATSETVPVVPPPEQPAKAAAETPPPATTEEPVTPAQVEQKKQIYDRIVGDQEIQGNTIVPTVEQPVQPEAPVVQPAAGTVAQPPPVPAEAAPAAQPGDSVEPLPLPLPPPPGENGTQGSLPSNAAQERVAAAQSVTSETAKLQAAEPAAAIAEAPVPGDDLANGGAAVNPAPVTQPKVAEPEVTVAPEVTAEEPVAKPAKKKVADKKAKAKKVESAVAASEPVVLVPPAGNAAGASPNTAGQAEQATLPAQESSGSGSFFDFGNSSGGSKLKKLKGKSSEQAASQGSGDAENQVALAEPQAFPEPEATPEPAPVPASTPEESATAPATGGAGYVAQLASFRSEAEALAEFDRLRAKHPSVLGGLSSRVSKGSAGGITRYRLGVGPLSGKSEADGICNKLIAAGERDCLSKRL